jgi:IS5 family transposase
MNQALFGFDPLPKKTCKEVFLEEMNLVVPWARAGGTDCAARTGARQAPKAGARRLRSRVMLRIHFLQQWFNLSDPAMEEELVRHGALFRAIRRAGHGRGADLPDETTILRFSPPAGAPPAEPADPQATVNATGLTSQGTAA